MLPSAVQPSSASKCSAGAGMCHWKPDPGGSVDLLGDPRLARDTVTEPRLDPILDPWFDVSLDLLLRLPEV